MDALSRLVRGTRAAEAFLLRVSMRSPWGISIEDEAPLSVVTVLTGQAWLRVEDAEPVLLAPNDVLLVRAPTRYVLTSDRRLVPSITIGPDQQCSGGDGADLSERYRSEVRAWGNDSQGPDQLLVGSYRTAGEVGRLLLDALPPYLVTRTPDDQLVGLILRELALEDPGTAALLDRLMDALMVSALREWQRDATGHPPSWLRAQQDPAVFRALQVLHERPSEPWTVDGLAGEVGLSRAALARRFSDEVGEPPMTHLSRWRLAAGADLLRTTSHTLAAIARQVGFATEFSFSKAFKAQYGVSPREFRRHVDHAS